MDSPATDDSSHRGFARLSSILSVREPWEEWALAGAATLLAAAAWIALFSRVRFIDDSVLMASTFAVALATLVLTRLWMRRKAPITPSADVPQR